MKSTINFDSKVVLFRQSLKSSKPLSLMHDLTKTNIDLCLRGEEYIYKNTLGVYSDNYLIFNILSTDFPILLSHINYLDSIFLAFMGYPVVFVTENESFYSQQSYENTYFNIETIKTLESQVEQFITINSLISKYFSKIKPIKYSIISENEFIKNKGNIFFKNEKLKEKSNVKIISRLLPHYLMELIRSKYNATFSIRTQMNTNPTNAWIDSYYDVVNNPDWITNSFLFEANDKLFKILTEKLPPKLDKDMTLEINLAGKNLKSKIPSLRPILK